MRRRRSLGCRARLPPHLAPKLQLLAHHRGLLLAAVHQGEGLRLGGLPAQEGSTRISGEQIRGDAVTLLVRRAGQHAGRPGHRGDDHRTSLHELRGPRAFEVDGIHQKEDCLHRRGQTLLVATPPTGAEGWHAEIPLLHRAGAASIMHTLFLRLALQQAARFFPPHLPDGGIVNNRSDLALGLLRHPVVHFLLSQGERSM